MKTTVYTNGYIQIIFNDFLSPATMTPPTDETPGMTDETTEDDSDEDTDTILKRPLRDPRNDQNEQEKTESNQQLSRDSFIEGISWFICLFV